MATLKTKPTKPLAIHTQAEADEALEEIGRAEGAACVLKDELEERVRNIRAAYAGRIGVLLERADQLRQDIEAWAEESVYEHQFEGGKRSLDLVHGRIGWRGAWSVRLTRTAEKVIAALRERRLPDAIIVKESVDKNVLAAYDDETLKALGAKRTWREEFFVEPKAELGTRNSGTGTQS